MPGKLSPGNQLAICDPILTVVLFQLWLAFNLFELKTRILHQCPFLITSPTMTTTYAGR